MPTDFLYYEAARIVSKVIASKGTLRTLCYSSKFNNKASLLALASETCRRNHTTTALMTFGHLFVLLDFDILEFVVEKSGILKVEKTIESRWLAMVLLQDFLFKGSLSCQEKLKASIMRHKSRLHSEFVRAKLKLGLPKEEASTSRTKKYIRLNGLKGTPESIMSRLEALGFRKVEYLKDCEADEKVYMQDEHLSGLIVVPSGLDLSKNPLYVDGSLIIQDKASCIPAYILAPPAGSTVVDTCSAPGNKTSHLAALVGLNGKVFAFERDQKRFETLNKMLGKAHCSHVMATCGDFLKVDPFDPKFRAVEYCLVDPSCSGSGIIKEHETASQDMSSERLKSLSNFQKMILRHAMKLPNLKRLVYSTCSVHEEENEMVVAEVLEREPGWELVEKPLPSWPRRGIESYPFAESLIRADPKADEMHGFFVALFQKKPSTA